MPDQPAIRVASGCTLCETKNRNVTLILQSLLMPLPTLSLKNNQPQAMLIAVSALEYSTVQGKLSSCPAIAFISLLKYPTSISQ